VRRRDLPSGCWPTRRNDVNRALASLAERVQFFFFVFWVMVGDRRLVYGSRILRQVSEGLQCL